MDDNALSSARDRHQSRAARQFEGISGTIRIVAAAIVIAIVLRSFVLEPFNIPSESMLPTLRAGDYLFVAKWPYGFSRYSLPLAPPLLNGRIGDSPPHRGDVVVFKTPRDNRTDYIKRVVGLPGDRVRMVDGAIELNGVLVPRIRSGNFLVEALAGSGCHDAGWPVHSSTGKMFCSYPRYIEQLGSRRYAVLDQIISDAPDNTPIFTVSAGHYFVEGDNRDDSADSRMSIADGGVGMIPAEDLIGRAEVVFFSTSGTAVLARPATWLATLRLGRIGTRL